MPECVSNSGDRGVVYHAIPAGQRCFHGSMQMEPEILYQADMSTMNSSEFPRYINFDWAEFDNLLATKTHPSYSALLYEFEWDNSVVKFDDTQICQWFFQEEKLALDQVFDDGVDEKSGGLRLILNETYQDKLKAIPKDVREGLHIPYQIEGAGPYKVNVIKSRFDEIIADNKKRFDRNRFVMDITDGITLCLKPLEVLENATADYEKRNGAICNNDRLTDFVDYTLKAQMIYEDFAAFDASVIKDASNVYERARLTLAEEKRLQRLKKKGSAS